VNELCQYSARHNHEGVLATGTIDCGPVGIIPACDKCIQFYERMSQ